MVVIGLDEAGLGPAFGSLWASAVHIPEGLVFEHLTDSKKVSEKRRNRLREEILASSCLYGLGEVTHVEIDEYGLAECHHLVFERALDDLFRKHPDLAKEHVHLIVDGIVFRPYKSLSYECMVKADAKVPHVSAASILATAKCRITKAPVACKSV